MTPDRAVFAFLLACLVAVALLWAVAVQAQPFPAMGPNSTDILTIENGDVPNTATVFYSNSGAMTSKHGEHELVAPNGVSALCIIEINAVQAAERITCMAADGFIAYPVEADVDDGDETTILIAPPLM